MANSEAAKLLQPDEVPAMAERASDAEKCGAGNPAPPPAFFEVKCRSSGEVRRFAAGTTARYALHAVNRKLPPGAPAALHVEASKDGEEPVSFGPNAQLADYGSGWRLQTVTEHDAPGMHQTPSPDTGKRDGEEAQQYVKKALDMEALRKKTAAAYLAKIGLAFVFIFLLGGLFTYLLETLPDMIQRAATPHDSL